MATWQELTVPGLVTSLVTGGALLFQTWRTGVREDKRRGDDADQRQLDRKHALSLAEFEVRQQQDERWRDERRAAYVELLETSQGLLRDLSRADIALHGKALDDFRLDGRVGVAALELNRIQALIDIVGSDEAAKAAKALALGLQGAFVVTSAMVVSKAEDSQEWADKKRFEAERLHEAFLTSARRDIGTS